MLFAMALSVVKGALRHVCTLRPVFLFFAPQAPCHSRGRPSLSVPKSIPANSTPLPYHPLPRGSTCPRPLVLECPQSKRTLPSKEKQKWTEKRQNGPTLLLLSRLLTGPEKGAPPEEGSFEDDDNRDNKSSCCVRARLHFGPLFVRLVIQ